MGFRDDETALAARRDVVAEAVAKKRARFRDLDDRGRELAQEVRRKRWKLRLRRVLRWIRRHPKLSFSLALVVGISSYVAIDGYLEARAHRREIIRVLGRDCEARLRVVTQVKARLFIGDFKIGTTPQELPICLGRYLVRLVHDDMIPWQRWVTVGSRGKQTVTADLVPWQPSARPRGSVLLLSRPDGALVFVAGREVGRTPLIVRSAALRQGRTGGKKERTVLVGVAAPGYTPFAQKIPLKGQDVWIHLARRPKGER
ncbi:MAG: hypothetical protein KAI47_15190 [Deltaproteobacteria bacterium]|nr:hypothetical protein [Deltaproteobacteria bacterium]